MGSIPTQVLGILEEICSATAFNGMLNHAISYIHVPTYLLLATQLLSMNATTVEPLV